MNSNQLKYKLFKSFKIPMTPEDRVVGKVSVNNGDLFKLSVVVDDLNFDFITFSSSERIPNELIDVELQRPAKLFGKEKTNVQGNLILTKRSQDASQHKFQYTLNIESNDSYRSWLESFISNFSKKRLHSYLLASATRMKELDFEDMSETVCLLIDSYQSIAEDNNDLRITDYLYSCKEILGCEKVRIWLYDVSDNTLTSQYSTEENESEMKIDYRKGVPGKVFNNGEIVNIYKAPFLSSLERNSDSVLAAPVTNRFHKVVGVLEFENKKEDLRFTREDEFMIRTLSVCFSTHFQMFNPVNAASKVKLFNPGLKNNFLNLIEINQDQSIMHMIQKMKNNKENILINNSSVEALEIVLEELISTSHYHDWQKVHFAPGSNLSDIKELKKTILILENADKLSKVEQENIVEFIDQDNAWVISTCHSKDVDKSSFTTNFWNKFAKHHLNFQRTESNETTDESFLKLAKSVQNISSFDEKIDFLTETLGLSSEKEKQVA